MSNYYDSYEVVQLKLKALDKAQRYELDRQRVHEENIMVEAFGVRFHIPLNADTYDWLIDQGLATLTEEMFPEETGEVAQEYKESKRISNNG